MPTGFTTVTAAYLQDASGTPISNATISFLPVLNNGTPTSFQSGGATGQTIATAVSAQVASGAFSIELADTTLTTPRNVGYRVAVTDNVSGKVLLAKGYECVQPSGSAWSFDSYVPNLAPQVTVQLGPAGLSAYQVYQANGGNLSQTAWLASLVGAPGTVSAGQLGAAAAATATFLGERLGPGLSVNLLNPASALVGGVVTNASGPGRIDSSLTFLRATERIVVAGAAFVTCNQATGGGDANYGAAFWNADGTLNSTLPGTVAANTPIAVPAGAFSFQTTIQSVSALATLMVVLGPTLPGSYQAFGYTPSETINLVREATVINNTVAGAVGSLERSSGFPARNLLNTAVGSPGFYLDVSDALIANSYCYTTEFLYVGGFGHLICDHDVGGGGGGNVTTFYGADKVSIVGQIPNVIAANTPFAVPANAVFVRMFFYNDQSILNNIGLYSGSTLPATFIPYNFLPHQSAPWAGKKIGFFGDSILANQPLITQLIAQNLGMSVAFNDAVSGRTTAQMLIDFRTGTFVNPGSSPPTGLVAGATLAATLANVDLVLIESLGNDPNTPLGSDSDSSSTWSEYGSTLVTAVRHVLENILLAKPTIRIVWVTPYLQINRFAPAAGLANTLLQCVQVVQNTCYEYGVPVIEMARISGFSGPLGVSPGNLLAPDGSSPGYTGDGVHANTLGAPVYAATVARALMQYAY